MGHAVSDVLPNVVEWHRLSSEEPESPGTLLQHHWMAVNEPAAGCVGLLQEFRRLGHGCAEGIKVLEEQMLALPGPLMSQPKLLVLDEPSMGLSPKLVDEILDVIQRLTATGMSILLVEQNAKLTFEATTHCFVMENGEFVMDGPADDLHPQVRRIYLGI